MRSLKRLSLGTKDDFWAVVRDCLVDLFGVSSQVADSLSNDRRAAVEFVPKPLKSNVYYHREPFDVAADLAARTTTATSPALSNPAVEAAYEAILTRHGLA